MKYNSKWCWLATEVKGGWRLKLAFGSKDYNLVGAIFKTKEEIERITCSCGKVVYIHLKNSKFPV